MVTSAKQHCGQSNPKCVPGRFMFSPWNSSVAIFACGWGEGVDIPEPNLHTYNQAMHHMQCKSVEAVLMRWWHDGGLIVTRKRTTGSNPGKIDSTPATIIQSGEDNKHGLPQNGPPPSNVPSESALQLRRESLGTPLALLTTNPQALARKQNKTPTSFPPLLHTTTLWSIIMNRSTTTNIIVRYIDT